MNKQTDLSKLSDYDLKAKNWHLQIDIAEDLTLNGELHRELDAVREELKKRNIEIEQIPMSYFDDDDW